MHCAIVDFKKSNSIKWTVKCRLKRLCSHSNYKVTIFSFLTPKFGDTRRLMYKKLISFVYIYAIISRFLQITWAGYKGENYHGLSHESLCVKIL